MRNKFKALLLLPLFSFVLSGCSIKDVFSKFSSKPAESNVPAEVEEVKEPEEQKPAEETPAEEQPVEPESDPVLVSIAVSGEFKSEYEVGEEFDSTGIIVTAHFDKGEDKDVSSEASFSGFDSSVAGECIVTVSYEGKSAEISLTIVEPAVVYTAELIASAFNEAISAYGLSASYYDIEGVFTGWYLGVYFSTSEDDSEDNLGSAAYTLASFLPDSMLLYDEGYDEATSEKAAQYSMVFVTEDFSVASEVYGFLDSGYLSAEIYIYDVA